MNQRIYYHRNMYQRLSKSHSDRKVVSRLLLWGLLLGAVGSAGAADLTEITLGPSGPDGALPIRSAFYLKGTASKDVSEIHPVFVRYRFLPWNITTKSRSCREVEAALSTLKQSEGAATKKFPAGQGLMKVDDLWAKPVKRPSEPEADFQQRSSLYDSLKSYHQAYIPGAWIRDAAKEANTEATFKILVPKTAFFQDSAQYCMLLYRERTSLADASTLERALEDYATAVLSCEKANPGTPQSACINSEYDIVKKALAELLQKTPDPAGKVRKLFTGNIGKIATFLKHGETFKATLDAIVTTNEKTLNQKFLPIGDREAALVRVLLPVLSRTQLLSALPNATTQETGFVTPDSKIQVRYAQFQDNSLLISSVADPSAALDKAAVSRTIPLTLEQLSFADSGLSVKDIFELLNGNIRLDGSSRVPLSRLSATLFPYLSKPVIEIADLPDEARLAQITELKARLDAFKRLLERAAANPGAPPPLAGTDESAYQQLGFWLKEQRASLLRLVSTLSNRVDEQLFDIQKRRELHANTIKALQVLLTELYGPVVDVRLSVSRDSWFFSYVTPITGFGAILNTADTFWLNYVGVQIYLFPNPVDQPMWTNGKDDLRRLLSLELGVATASAPYGPDNRYGGFSAANLRPLFVGVGAQIIPYITLSAGAVIMSRKISTLEAEKAATFVSPYVGISAQLNVPDAINALVGRKLSITAP